MQILRYSHDIYKSLYINIRKKESLGNLHDLNILFLMFILVSVFLVLLSKDVKWDDVSLRFKQNSMNINNTDVANDTVQQDL